MKVSPGYSPASVYHPHLVKKFLAGSAIFLFFASSVPAQDSLPLRSFKDSYLYNTPPFLIDVKKLTGFQSSKKGTYLFTQHIRFSPDTVAINDRYKPGAHPALLWNLTYPLTENQRMAEVEKQRQESQIGRQIAYDVIQTIMNRRKIPAVKPTL